MLCFPSAEPFDVKGKGARDKKMWLDISTCPQHRATAEKSAVPSPIIVHRVVVQKEESPRTIAQRLFRSA
jgi:hypothetical protein